MIRIIAMLLCSSVLLLSDESDGRDLNLVGRDVDSLFEPWSSLSTPGCAVGVIENGELVLSRAYGAANLEHKVPNKTESVFEVGSVSKQFTAAAILLLARDNRLSLGDDIRDYIPEMPDYGDVITIDHLLTHTSGIRDWGIVAEMAGWGRTTRVMGNDDALKIVIRQKHLNFRPGDRYAYTNSGYVLSAIMVERVTGMSLQQFAEKEIFGPLGMTATRWRDDFRQVIEGQSRAYMKTDRGYVEVMPFENVYGDAGILTSIRDMLTWNDALTANRLGEYVSEKLQEPARLASGRYSNYARGLRIVPFKGTSGITHSGGIGAYRAWLGRFPEMGLSIAVACNAGDPDYTYSGDYFGWKVSDLFIPEPSSQEDLSQPVHITGIAGMYAGENSGIPVTLRQDDGLIYFNEKPLLIRSEERLALPDGSELVLTGEDRFRLETVDGNVQLFQRVEPVTGADVRDGELLGRYQSDEVGAIYAISSIGGTLALEIEGRPQVSFALTPAYKDAFLHDTRLGPDTVLVRFFRDVKGEVDELGISWRNKRVSDLRFKRIE